jgi:hypothetical protein
MFLFYSICIIRDGWPTGVGGSGPSYLLKLHGAPALFGNLIRKKNEEERLKEEEEENSPT